MFAAAPSRIVIGVTGKKAPEPRTLTIWSEEKDLNYSVSPTAEKWLSMKPAAGKATGEQRRYVIEVNPESLTPGRYQASIRIAASGVVNGPLTIPVTVEVSEKEK